MAWSARRIRISRAIGSSSSLGPRRQRELVGRRAIDGCDDVAGEDFRVTCRRVLQHFYHPERAVIGTLGAQRETAERAVVWIAERVRWLEDDPPATVVQKHPEPVCDLRADVAGERVIGEGPGARFQNSVMGLLILNDPIWSAVTRPSLPAARPPTPRAPIIRMVFDADPSRLCSLTNGLWSASARPDPMSRRKRRSNAPAEEVTVAFTVG